MAADTPSDLMSLLQPAGLNPLTLAGRRLLPIVQGGMGVGISAHRLAGSVAALGAVGTISSVDLRRLHPDLMERTHDLAAGAAATLAAKLAINEANLEALSREIHAARKLSGGRGLLAINVDKPDEIGPAWDRALAAARPTVLDVRCDPNVPPIPPHATFEQAKNAAKAMLHGDEDRWGVIKEGVKTKVQEFLPHSSE